MAPRTKGFSAPAKAAGCSRPSHNHSLLYNVAAIHKKANQHAVATRCKAVNACEATPSRHAPGRAPGHSLQRPLHLRLLPRLDAWRSERLPLRAGSRWFSVMCLKQCVSHAALALSRCQGCASARSIAARASTLYNRDSPALASAAGAALGRPRRRALVGRRNVSGAQRQHASQHRLRGGGWGCVVENQRRLEGGWGWVRHGPTRSRAA